MIKVGIIGAQTPDAGELLRILINHPEVDILSLYAPSLTGHRISSVHHGFIGETDFFFVDKIDPSKLDAIFIAENSPIVNSLIEHIGDWEDLRVIDMSPDRHDDWKPSEFVYGLSEMNRKALVRGARLATVPTPIASVSLIPLYPLAAHLLLTSDIEINVKLPESLVTSIDINRVAEEIENQLKSIQHSFDSKVNISLHPSNSLRSIRESIIFKCSLGIDEISRILEETYDDHNFTFTTRESVSDAEVEGTQKCLIFISKPGAGLLELEVVADGFLRGGAGDATHILNLLFSLHEKVGLCLKPTLYNKGNTLSPDATTSWFA
ncbi:MAG: hypothetical protein K2J82_04915 [Muribaculaceae bacterium]|nr:hypothetical protein [Muribaculaceae bacterium]MDE6753937.1 hypothetical protein [Muribaculaceae bacterium]